MRVRLPAFPRVAFLLAVLAPYAAQAAGEHGQESEKASLPQLDPTWYASEAFWLAVHFIVLYFFAARVILPRIADKHKRREARVAEDLAAAEKMVEEAKQVRQQYLSELAKARARANKIRVDAVAACKEENRKAEEALNAELARRVADTHARLEEEGVAVRQELQATVCDTAQTIIGKISGQSFAPEIIEKALQKVANDQKKPSAREAY